VECRKLHKNNKNHKSTPTNEGNKNNPSTPTNNNCNNNEWMDGSLTPEEGKKDGRDEGGK
jgi:hypothetical protein